MKTLCALSVGLALLCCSCAAQAIRYNFATTNTPPALTNIVRSLASGTNAQPFNLYDGSGHIVVDGVNQLLTSSLCKLDWVDGIASDDAGQTAFSYSSGNRNLINDTGVSILNWDGASLAGNAGGLTNITLSISGTNATPPLNTSTIRAWVNVTLQNGDVLKMPLYK